MVLDLQASSFIKDVGFWYLIKSLEPRYTLPYRTTFRNKLLPVLYQNVLMKLKLEIEDEVASDGAISITTNAWTSNSTSSFVTYTIHFIREDFTMALYNLEIFEYKRSLTSANLKKQIHAAQNCWGAYTQPGHRRGYGYKR